MPKKAREWDLRVDSGLVKVRRVGLEDGPEVGLGRHACQRAGMAGVRAPVRSSRELSMDAGILVASPLIHTAEDGRKIAARSCHPTTRTLSGRFRRPPTVAREI